MESKLDKTLSKENPNSQVLLNNLPYFELCRKVWDNSVSNQDILNEVFSRLKAKQIEIWQFRNLIVTMRDRDTLTLPVTLIHDTPKIRKFLFEKLLSKVGALGISYWSGTPESRNKDFVILAQDISKIDTDNIMQCIHIQNRAINSLAKLLLHDDRAATHVREIASAFLDFPIINTKPVLAMRSKIEDMFRADSLQAEENLSMAGP